MCQGSCGIQLSSVFSSFRVGYGAMMHHLYEFAVVGISGLVYCSNNRVAAEIFSEMRLLKDLGTHRCSR